MSYQVFLPSFEGPLDLLLHLIEKNEMDITTLSLARVTDDFLRTIEAMGQQEPDTIADFLVVAAKLVLIKSTSLLPVERVTADPERTGEELARALEVYRHFKQVAQGLGEREAQNLRSYARAEVSHSLTKRLDPGGLTLNDLFKSLKRILQEKEPEPETVDTVVRPLRITVRQRLTELTHALRQGQPLPFTQLLSDAPDRQEVIVTFLALLEVIRLGWARVTQEQLWGEILLVPQLDVLPERGEDEIEVEEYNGDGEA
jgi:segregation and condensation protein A